MRAVRYIRASPSTRSTLDAPPYCGVSNDTLGRRSVIQLVAFQKLAMLFKMDSPKPMLIASTELV